MNDTSVAQQAQQHVDAIAALRQSIAEAIVGQHDVVEQLLIGLFAGGHCLLEGVPGLGKTLLVQSLGEALELDFRRIQFTPDLMPGDIIGTDVLEEDRQTGKRHFTFQRGPVFTNLLLADELNRTPPKTQAALLEAMQERTVSYSGHTHLLPRPFFVLATQNPIEQAGTYPLPEAQLDRFLLQIRVAYPDVDEERAILARTTGVPGSPVTQVMGGDQVLAIQQLVRQVHLGDDLLHWVADLVRASRPHATPVQQVGDWLRWGAGPRGGQSLILAAKARALIHGRYAVTRDDLTALAAPVLRHRVLLSFRAEAEGIDADQVIGHLLDQVPAPA